MCRLRSDTGNLQEPRYAFGKFVLEAFVGLELSRLYQFGALLCYCVAHAGDFLKVLSLFQHDGHLFGEVFDYLGGAPVGPYLKYVLPFQFEKVGHIMKHPGDF